VVAPLPRRVAKVIRRAVDDLVEPAGEAPGDALTAARGGAGAPATLAAPAARVAPQTPSATDDTAAPVAGRTPDEWWPR
jgi:hypothetical protein